MSESMRLGFARAILAEREAGLEGYDILDVEDGLAARWGRVAMENHRELRKVEDDASKFLAEEYLRQAQVWDLLAKITSLRKHPERHLSRLNPQDLISRSPYIPPKDLMQALHDYDPILQELDILKSNLQSFTSPSTAQSSSSSTSHPRSLSTSITEHRHQPHYRQETLQSLKRGRGRDSPAVNTDGSGSGSGRARGNVMATSMDIDADLREGGRDGAGGLVGNDKNREQKIVLRLFDFLRQGDLDGAEAYCLSQGEGWRAASIIGGKAWGLRGSGKGRGKGKGTGEGDVNMDGEAEGEGAELESEPEPENLMSGNVRRDLWKKTCKAIAGNNALPPNERALYAALAGDLDNTLPLCKNWQDHLWAHTNAKLSSRLDASVSNLGGYWQNQYGSTSKGNDVDGTYEGYLRGMKEVFEQIGNSADEDVAADAADYYPSSIEGIVTNQLSGVISSVTDNIEEIDRVEYPLLAFFTHLALFLHKTGDLGDPDALTKLTGRYLAHLAYMEQWDHELAGLYCSELPEGREESFEQYLREVETKIELNFVQKKSALQSARQMGLNSAYIASIEVGRTKGTVDYVLGTLLSKRITYPAYKHIDDEEWTRTAHQSLEWYLCSDDTFGAAVESLNYYLRYHLVCQQVDEARGLIGALPDDFWTAIDSDAEHTDAVEDQLDEFGLHQKLLKAIEAMGKAEKVWQDGRKALAQAMPSQKTAWASDHTDVINAAYEAFMTLITTTVDEDVRDWIHWLPQQEQIGSPRTATYKRIQAIYLGDLLLRLHDLLVMAGKWSRTQLQRALNLPILLADPDIELAAILLNAEIGDRPKPSPALQAYIEKIRDLGMTVLGQGKDGIAQAVWEIPAGSF